MKEAKIETVFEQIKKETGYPFLYTTEEIKDAKPVTVSFQNLSLAQALTVIFTGQPLRYSVEDKYVVVKAGPEEKQQTAFEIWGRVVNDRGEGLSNVSVSIKNTRKGIATDTDGRFRLESPSREVMLVVTSVGFEEKEVAASAGRALTITLTQTVSKLDEQLIIAYGSTTKRVAVGTVSKVSKEDIQQQPVSNPIAVLAGRVSGLQVIQGSGLPGTFYTIRLRGQNSIANGNDPLIIIDGVPFPTVTLNGSFSGGGGAVNSPLNNLDPSDIESIEVLKDANATAIYGSRGSNGVILITTKKGNVGKTSVEINAYTGWGKFQRRLKLLTTPEYIAMRKEAFANDGVQPTASNARDLALWDTTRYTDWQKTLLGKTMRISDVKFSVSDGNQNTQFLMGGGYHKETTVMPMDFGETKLSGHFSVRHKSDNNRLNLSVYGSFLANKNLLPQTDVSSLITLPPDAPRLYDSAGRLNWENSTWTNPLSLLLKQFRTNTDNLIFNTTASYKLLPSLEFKNAISFNRIWQTENISLPISSNNPAFNATGTAGFGSNTISTAIIEPQLNFQRRAFKGTLSILGGYTVQESRQQALYQIGSGYPNDDLLKSLRAAPTVTISNEINSVYRYTGAFGRVNYDYNGRYIAEVNVRRDGSSRYGPANRFANFGSVGLAWIFSREKFMNSVPFVTYGKLKVSGGITGNDQIGDYKYLDTYSPYTYSYLGVVPLQPTQLFNPDFGWERVKKEELGLDMGFQKNRILLTLNYYHNVTTNQLVSYALPVMTGFSGVLKNLPATIVNQGIEIEVSATLFQKKQFKWISSFNLSIPKNKLAAFDDIGRSTYSTTYIVGQPLFISRVYSYTGIDRQTGNYTFEDVNKDGKISTPEDVNAVVFTGQQYFGGLQNNIAYKGFSLSFLFQFVRQKNALDYSSRFGKPGTMSNQPRYVLDRWLKIGDDAGFQKFSNSNGLNNAAFSNLLSSNAAFSDASFIRLKSFDLSWQPDVQKLKMKFVKQCVVFIQGSNLLTFSKYRGLDPETKSVFPPVSMMTVGFRFNY